MPVEITLDGLPGGYSVNAARDGELVQVQTMEFITSDEGESFITKVEGLPDDLLRRLPPGRRVPPSQVDSLLAVIRPDKTATVYVNELPYVVEMRAGGDIKAGQRVGKDDIADIVALAMPGVTVPPDAGVVFLFSVGWRKGLFYDLGPLTPDPEGERPRRAFNINAMFGQVYAQLLFQERFAILDAEWESFFACRWFPFAALSHKTIQDMLAYVRAGWSVDDLTRRVVDEVKQKVPAFLKAWEKHPAFKDHFPLLRSAADRFVADDYVSCTAIVFPRIEGLMRSNHAGSGAAGKATQENLSRSAVSVNADRDSCLLLPHRFERYLREVYFASFDPTSANIAVSRNSVGHGVAGADQFDGKAAAIGLLVVHQLFYCFERPAS